MPSFPVYPDWLPDPVADFLFKSIARRIYVPKHAFSRFSCVSCGDSLEVILHLSVLNDSCFTIPVTNVSLVLNDFSPWPCARSPICRPGAYPPSLSFSSFPLVLPPDSITDICLSFRSASANPICDALATHFTQESSHRPLDFNSLPLDGFSDSSRPKLPVSLLCESVKRKFTLSLDLLCDFTL